MFTVESATKKGLKFLIGLIGLILNKEFRTRLLNLIAFTIVLIPIIEFLLKLIFQSEIRELIDTLFKIGISTLLSALILVVNNFLLNGKLIDALSIELNKEIDELKNMMEIVKKELEKELEEIKKERIKVIRFFLIFFLFREKFRFFLFLKKKRVRRY